MALQNTGEITVDVNRTAAFEFARNAQQMAECIPGCHDLQELSPNRYAAVLTSEVAFMTVSFKVVVEVVRIDPPNAIEVTATGDAMKLSARLVAKASLQFADASENHTLIRYSADIGLTGKLAGLGQPVLKVKSAELTRQFGANLKAAIEKVTLPTSQEGARA